MKSKIEFLHQEYKNDSWNDLKPLVNESKKKENTELDNKIKSIVNKSKNKPVKPGYKKKVKDEIERVKAKHRREIIKKDIKKRIKERAIERTKKEKGYDARKTCGISSCVISSSFKMGNGCGNPRSFFDSTLGKIARRYNR